MHCPNCAAPDMLTRETFKLDAATYRTKKCRACRWTFTTIETIAEEQKIPKVVRDVKRTNKALRLPQPPAAK